MPDYSKGIIYKLCCNDLNIKEIYVGSTCNFTRRKYGHKWSCNNEKDRNHNICVYQYIRNNGGWDNWDMIMIQEHPCENKRQLERRERFWIESLNPALNKQIPSRTKKEYYTDNKQGISEYKKEYREKNKDKIFEKKKKYRENNKQEIREKKKEYYEKNKDKINEKKKEYYEKNKEKIKEYQEKNKEKISEKRKEYYEKNKEKLIEKRREKRKEKYTCICGSTISKNSKSKHEKSIKHQKFIESQKE